MDAAPRTTLNRRLADACRLEQAALPILAAIAANRTLPGAIRDRAELHHVETQAQFNQTLALLEGLAPSLAARLRVRPSTRVEAPAGLAQWMDLERREIEVYQSVLAYCMHGPAGDLVRVCAAAIDLQRAVLAWLESGEGSVGVVRTAEPADLRLAS